MIKFQNNIFYLKAVVITGCFFITGCSNNYQEVQDLAKKKIPVDTATQVESYLSQDGIVKAKLTAPIMTTVSVSDSPTTEFPKSLHVDFFDTVQKFKASCLLNMVCIIIISGLFFCVIVLLCLM